MNPSLKIFLAIIGGLVTGVAFIMLIQKLGHAVVPPPSDLDFNDKEALHAFMKNAPVSAMLFVIASYAIGSFFGGIAAAVICPEKRERVGLSVGAILLLAGLVNFIMIPHQLWVAIVGLLGFIPAAWLGQKIAPTEPG